MSGEPELFRVLQVAEILGLSKRQAYDWVARGILPGIVRAGRRIFIRRRALELWLDGHDGAIGFGEGNRSAAHARVGFDGGAPRPGYSSCSRNTREVVQSGQNDDSQ